MGQTLTISFTVYGLPQPRGSKRSYVPLNRKTGDPYRRAGGGVMVQTVDTNPKGKDWMNSVRCEARKHAPPDLFCGPMLLEVDFFVPRPKGHFGTGRNAGNLKLTAPEYPTTKPDRLKLARGLEDALTGVIYRDDSQIVGGDIRKNYGDVARTEITLTELSL